MTVRKRRKKNKLRGQRTHGHGGTKNRRGSGVRGGTGRAGSHKHKFTKYFADFGKGIILKPKNKIKAINLQTIEAKKDAWLKKGLLTKEEDYIVIDGKKIGFDKILSKGRISFKAVVRNMQVTENAREKIEQMEGGIEEKTEKEKGESNVN